MSIKFNFNEELKKMILAGVGATAVTVEKAEEIVNYCVEKGELTVEQGKVMNEELKRNVKDAVSQQHDKFTKEVKPKVDDILGSMEDLTAEEIKAVKDKIQAMEDKGSDSTDDDAK